MQVRRQFRCDGNNSLAAFTLGFTEKLLPPAAEHPESRVKAFKNFHSLALAVQQVPHRRIKPHRIFVGADIIRFLGIHCAVHHFCNINACHSHGKQSHRRQHRKTAAYRSRNGEGFPALFRCHLPQRTLQGISHRIDAAVGTVGAVFPLQNPAQPPECNGRFGGGSGFRDHDDRKIFSLQQSPQFVPMAGAEIIARKKDLGIATALADVMVGTLEQFNGRPGTKIAAADAHNHTGIRLPANLLCRSLNALHILRCLPNRQVQPAQIVAAGTGTLGQGLMGIKNLFFQRQQISKGNLAPHIGNIHSDHKRYATSFPFFSILCIIFYSISPLKARAPCKSFRRIHFSLFPSGIFF